MTVRQVGFAFAMVALILAGVWLYGPVQPAGVVTAEVSARALSPVADPAGVGQVVTSVPAAAPVPPAVAQSAVPQPDTSTPPPATPPPATAPPATPGAGPADSIAAQTTPASPAPLIDLVRVEPDGTTLIAGRAAPGMTVDIVVDDTTLAQAVADASGQFVAFATLPPADRPRILSLTAGPAGAAVTSDATVIIAPIAAPATLAVMPDPMAVAAPPTDAATVTVPPVGGVVTDRMVALTPVTPATPVATGPVPADPGGDAIMAGVAALTAPAGQPAPPVPAPPVPAPPVPAAPAPAPPALAQSAGQPSLSQPGTLSAPDPAGDPAVRAVAAITPPAHSGSIAAPTVPTTDSPAVAPVLLSDQTGIRLLQPAIGPGATPEVLATVALDSIVYDPGGQVQLTGRAMHSGMVRIYIDNQLVMESPVQADGVWQSGLPGIVPGIYTLRVDQIDAGGTVTSRIETPFLREERSALAAAMVSDTSAPAFQVAARTVQPGSTLWAIARDRYGDGVMYVQVFEANRDRIRNPDLIYPGQVFVLPDIAGPTGAGPTGAGPTGAGSTGAGQ